VEGTDADVITWIKDASPAANKFNDDSNIQPLLDSSQFSISRNLTIAIEAASVLWFDALQKYAHSFII